MGANFDDDTRKTRDDIKLKIKKIFNVQRVEIQKEFTNVPYSSGIQNNCEEILKGCRYWEFEEAKSFAIPEPLSKFYLDKKGIFRPSTLMKSYTKADNEQMIKKLENGFFDYDKDRFFYLPGVNVEPELIDDIPIIKRMKIENDLIHQVLSDQVCQETIGSIDGITEPYIYCSNPGSGFGAHVEDMHTMSLNVALAGGCKLWVGIDMTMMKKIELLLSYNEELNTKFQYCYTHPLAAKSFTFTKDFLMKNRIRYMYFQQMPGDIIITFPFGLHFGYNLNINLNVASNHVYKGCLPYAKTAQLSYRCLVS